MHIPALRRTRRLATVLLASVGLVVAAAATPALADDGSSGYGSSGVANYLALGDSVPFGFHNTTNPAIYLNPRNLVGYPELLAHEEHLRLANASCPGETTGSFINPTKDVFKCEGPAGYRTNFPLHVRYAGSQLAFALHYLRTTPDVRLVTLQLGANDVFLCQATTADHCASPAELQPVLAKVHANIAGILTALRTQGHYRGRIVVVDYYSLNYADPVDVQGTLALDQAIDTAALQRGARVASGFLAFARIALLKGHGDSRAAGLVRPAPDVHPTPFGQEVLEDAVQFVFRH
jgi:GDSL-like Lipase/Acylhydrolase family